MLTEKLLKEQMQITQNEIRGTEEELRNLKIAIETKLKLKENISTILKFNTKDDSQETFETKIELITS